MPICIIESRDNMQLPDVKAEASMETFRDALCCVFMGAACAGFVKPGDKITLECVIVAGAPTPRCETSRG